MESDRLDSGTVHGALYRLGDPSIGFIGTVRGIGDALGQAYKAVEGDISGRDGEPRGGLFNSTFVALVLSIIIMFCLHQLQLSQNGWCWTASATPTSACCATCTEAGRVTTAAAMGRGKNPMRKVYEQRPHRVRRRHDDRPAGHQ